MNASHPLVASGALLLGALFWGAMVPMTWLLTQTWDVWALAMVRYFIGLPLLALFAWLWARDRLRRDLPWRRILQLGLPMALFSILYNLGIAHAHPVTAAVIMMCGPLTYTLIGHWMVRTPIPAGFGLALLLSVIGGVVVVLGDPARRAAGLGLQGGEPLLLVTQFIWAWYSIRAQQWLGHCGQLVLSFTTTGAACLWLLAVYLGMLAFGAVPLPDRLPTSAELFYLVWCGAGGVALAILLWNYGVSRLALPVASLHNNAVPVFTALTSALLGVAPSWQQILGGLIVLGGVAVLQLRQIFRPRRP